MKLGNHLSTLMERNIENGVVTFLVGPAGIGKTSVSIDTARAINGKVFVIQCNTMSSREDLTGARLVKFTNPNTGEDDYKQMFFPPDELVEAINYAEAHPDEPVLVVLDEINRSNSDVTSGIMTISTARKLGSRKLSNNISIIATGNDKGNIVSLDSASISRFQVIRVKADARVLMDHLGDKCHEYVAKVLTEHPDYVQHDGWQMVTPEAGQADDDDSASVDAGDLYEEAEEIRQATNPRTIENLCRWLHSTSIDELRELSIVPSEVGGEGYTELMEVVHGYVGNTPFSRAVLVVIGEQLTKQATSASRTTVRVTKPRSWAKLAAAPTANALTELVDAMSEHDRSGCMVAALYEHRDNARIINELVAQLPDGIEKDHLAEIGRLASQSLLNEANVNTVLTSTAVQFDGLRAILDVYY